MAQGDGDDQSLSPKDRVDAYLKLADTWRGRWDRRNQTEWRITFSIWGVLAAGIYGLARGDAQTLTINLYWLAIVLFAIFFGHAYILYNISRRNHHDARRMFVCVAEVERLVLSEALVSRPKCTRPSFFRPLIDYSFWFQLAVTAFLQVIIFAAMANAGKIKGLIL